jgi:hypothetical protein
VRSDHRARSASGIDRGRSAGSDTMTVFASQAVDNYVALVLAVALLVLLVLVLVFPERF